MNGPLRFVHGSDEHLYNFYLQTPIGLEDGEDLDDMRTIFKQHFVTFRVTFASNTVMYYTSKDRDGKIRRREFSGQPRARSSYFLVPRLKSVSAVEVAAKISPAMNDLSFPNCLQGRVVESLMTLIVSLDSTPKDSHIRPVEVAVEMIMFMKVVPPVSSITKDLPGTGAAGLPEGMKYPCLTCPKSKDEPSFSCPICLGFLVDETSTQCGHIFCRTCISKAVTAHRKCPICRRTVAMKDLIRVFFPASIY